MLRSLIIVTCRWLFCLYLPLANATAPIGPMAQAGGILFKVQDAHHTLYLFGTIHVGASDFYPLAPRIMHTLEQASAIALEIDPHQRHAMQAAVAQYGLYPAGQSFHTELSLALQQQVLAALARYHVAPQIIAPLRPWMIASLLTLQEFESKAYRAELGVDSYLADLMRKRHKPVLELEGAAAQLALFDRLDNQQQSRLLEDTLQELSDPGSAAKIVALAQYWRHADLPGLQGLLDEMATDHSLVGRFTKEVLLDQRNPVLSTRIAALLQQRDGVFAAIGILHLVGANSVPALLQQYGLKVERLY